MSEYRRQQAWEAGQKASFAGKGRESCNRPQGTIFFDDWHDGFNDGERAKWLEHQENQPSSGKRVEG